MNKVIFFLSVLFFFSCSSDDDASLNDSAQELEGIWNLVKIEGGFLGVQESFTKGIITWDFDTTESVVKVENQNMNLDNSFDGLETGTYPYIISAPADVDNLVINDNNFGTYEVRNDSLIIDQRASDGFKFCLIR